VEFIRRFLQHMLPSGLHHIRRFGFMGPRVRTERIAHIRQLLGVEAPLQESACQESACELTSDDPWDGDSDGQTEEDGQQEQTDPAEAIRCIRNARTAGSNPIVPMTVLCKS
jgi:hypothetical protein